MCTRVGIIAAVHDQSGKSKWRGRELEAVAMSNSQTGE
jgi:hypothetical protein